MDAVSRERRQVGRIAQSVSGLRVWQPRIFAVQKRADALGEAQVLPAAGSVLAAQDGSEEPFMVDYSEVDGSDPIA